MWYSRVAAILIMFLSLAFFLALIWLTRISSYDDGEARKPLTIAISLDSFRYDFLHRPQSSILQSMMKDSAYGPMQVQFPTYTFTNHYSLVTGQYPARHGIVANVFYDSEKGREFNTNNEDIIDERSWWLSEPIWETANKQGKKTANLFWPGDQGFKNSLHTSPHYDGKMSNTKRVQQLFKWIDNGPDLSFISIYFSFIDEVGHHHGPDSPAMNGALQEADNIMASIKSGLVGRGLWEKCNLIVSSDHGLVPAATHHNIRIHEKVPELRYMIEWMDNRHPVTTIFPKPKMTEAVFELLQKAITENELPVKVIYTEDLRDSYNFWPTTRIGPITLIADSGYTLCNGKCHNHGGFHGYAPEASEMHGLIMAHGPSISHKGLFKSPVNSLSYYSFIATLIGITPNPNDGTRELIELIL